MSIAPADLLDWATTAAGDGVPEAGCRAAVSRAYYGAYHSCRMWHDKLPEQGHNTGKPTGVHQQLINQLTKPSDACSDTQKSVSRQLGYGLKDLKGLREIADYELGMSVTTLNASEACMKARVLLRKAI
jgi:uncharacterized protein (UPF0332 family)